MDRADLLKEIEELELVLTGLLSDLQATFPHIDPAGEEAAVRPVAEGVFLKLRRLRAGLHGVYAACEARGIFLSLPPAGAPQFSAYEAAHLGGVAVEISRWLAASLGHIASSS